MSYEAKFNNWKNVNQKSLEFILEEGRLDFNHSVDLNKRVSGRAFTMISIYIPLISFLIGYIFTTEEKDPYTVIAALVFLFSTTICLFILTSIVKPIKKFQHPGMMPKLLLKGNYYTENKNLNKDEEYLALLINQVNVIQDSIDFNVKSNEGRLGKLRTVINLTIWSLSTSIFIFMLKYLSLLGS